MWIPLIFGSPDYPRLATAKSADRPGGMALSSNGAIGSFVIASRKRSGGESSG